ncbi:DUF6521 family protein [Aeromonas dhakensis]|uniref:three component ABC system middle component n=1 Tax=Aeromonas TaxID=642 RepID=UPI00244925D4|nr:three component ABC system middle component [Aeromonas dhakensis]MDH0177126.1 DUF6521 family protein [Aeromonas dhakensis]
MAIDNILKNELLGSLFLTELLKATENKKLSISKATLSLALTYNNKTRASLKRKRKIKSLQDFILSNPTIFYDFTLIYRDEITRAVNTIIMSHELECINIKSGYIYLDKSLKIKKTNNGHLFKEYMTSAVNISQFIDQDESELYQLLGVI